MKYVFEYDAPREINIGDVFYKIEQCDFRTLREPCKVCKDTHEVTVNGVTFKCPMCFSGKEICKVHSCVVKRYRVCNINVTSPDDDWKASDRRRIFIKLYHKSGKGYSGEHSNVESSIEYFARNLNDTTRCTDDQNDVFFDDYKLACETAERLISKQIEILQKYNAEYETHYEFERPTKHDAKST